MIYLNKFLKKYSALLLVIALLATGFLFFDWWLVLVEMVLGAAVWIFIEKGGAKKKQVSKKQDKNFFWVFVGIFALLVLSRVYPFSLSEAPLGYDTGIYRYEFWLSLQALPEYLSNLFLALPLLSDLWGIFGLSLDQMISLMYVLVYLLLPLSVYVTVERYQGRKTALIALFLLTVSIIQWKAYSMILFKQMLALAMVWSVFYMLWKRSYWVLVPLLFVAMLQPLDAFLLGLSVFVYALLLWCFPKLSGGLENTKVLLRKYYGFLVLIGVGTAVLLLSLDTSFWTKAWEIFVTGLGSVEGIESSLQKGVFLSLSDYGYQSAFFFVFGMVGLVYELKQRKMTAVSVYLLVLVVWIALGLFFYQRLLIQLDLELYQGSFGLSSENSCVFDIEITKFVKYGL